MIQRISFALCFALVGCNDDTGSGLVQFKAFAAGPEQAISGQPLVFDTVAGYRVQLDRARLTIGAVYLNRSRPTLGAQDTACVLPGIYAAEVTSGVVIDALSSEPVEFASVGHGTADRALTGEVWLTGARIDAEQDSTPILEYSGTATRAGRSYGFYGVVTISSNRVIGSVDPATPSANPLCKLRIVTPIPVDITPSDAGALTLRVAPDQWFQHVDFASLPGASEPAEALCIPDSYEGQAAVALFQGLRSVNAYHFHFSN